jgi:hypothetical protein
MRPFSFDLKFFKFSILAVLCIYAIIAIPCMMPVIQRVSDIMHALEAIQSRRSFEYSCSEICFGYNYQLGEEPVCCRGLDFGECRTKRECKLGIIDEYQR